MNNTNEVNITEVIAERATYFENKPKIYDRVMPVIYPSDPAEDNICDSCQ